MNKDEIRNEISNFQNKVEFEYIKTKLLRYKSITDLVNCLNYSGGTSIYVNGYYMTIGDNIKDIKNILLRIVSDYKTSKELKYRIIGIIKIFNLKYLLSMIKKIWL